MKKHNFNAGPSILPREVIEDTAKAILDFNGSGLSLMEISHRAKDFQPVVDEAEALFKELLNIPRVIRYCSLVVVLVWSSAWYLSTSLKKGCLSEYRCVGKESDERS